MISALDYSLLIRILIAHIISDFALQPSEWVEEKKKNKWFSQYLYIHAIISGILIYLFSGLWNYYWIPVLIIISHIIIDRIKVELNDSFAFFFWDQILHVFILILVWLSVIGISNVNLQMAIDKINTNYQLWMVILGYTIILWPSSIIIEKFLSHITSQVKSGFSSKWIGYLERFMVLTFVLLQQYAAIGFLLAAKSIYRYFRHEETDEYVFIGTLLSYSIAISVGVLILFLF